MEQREIDVGQEWTPDTGGWHLTGSGLPGPCFLNDPYPVRLVPMTRVCGNAGAPFSVGACGGPYAKFPLLLP